MLCFLRLPKTPAIRVPRHKERVYSISVNGSPIAAGNDDIVINVPIGNGEVSPTPASSRIPRPSSWRWPAASAEHPAAGQSDGLGGSVSAGRHGAEEHPPAAGTPPTTSTTPQLPLYPHLTLLCPGRTASPACAGRRRDADARMVYRRLRTFSVKSFNSKMFLFFFFILFSLLKVFIDGSAVQTPKRFICIKHKTFWLQRSDVWYVEVCFCVCSLTEQNPRREIGKKIPKINYLWPRISILRPQTHHRPPVVLQSEHQGAAPPCKRFSVNCFRDKCSERGRCCGRWIMHLSPLLKGAVNTCWMCDRTHLDLVCRSVWPFCFLHELPAKGIDPVGCCVRAGVYWGEEVVEVAIHHLQRWWRRKNTTLWWLY